MLIDTHCHLDFPEFDKDREQVIRNAEETGIAYIVNIGSSIAGSRKSAELAAKYDSIYAAVGIHPHEADTFDEDSRLALESLAENKKIVAIGETGLDYYRNYSAAESQKKLFRYSLGLAKKLKLPLVLHTRHAEEDTLNIVKEQQPHLLVVHCFSGSEGFLKECLVLGFFISFTCNITYKKAESLRRMVEFTPLERMMLETDAPFLAPEGLRGRRNEPAYVSKLAEEVSRIKEIDVEEVCRITTENAKRFFNLL